jgi:hypothetical protein
MSDEVFTKGTMMVSIGFVTGGDYPNAGVNAAIEYGVINFTPKIRLGVGGSLGYSTESNVNFTAAFRTGSSISSFRISRSSTRTAAPASALFKRAWTFRPACRVSLLRAIRIPVLVCRAVYASR